MKIDDKDKKSSNKEIIEAYEEMISHEEPLELNIDGSPIIENFDRSSNQQNKD